MSADRAATLMRLATVEFACIQRFFDDEIESPELRIWTTSRFDIRVLRQAAISCGGLSDESS